MLVALPVGTILWHLRASSAGSSVDHHPAAISAPELTDHRGITVPLNVVFGIVVALGLVRALPGKSIVQAIVDTVRGVLVIVGVALIMLWGTDGWFGGVEASASVWSSDCPAWCWPPCVTLPFIV